jgi:hypothetical protein
MKASLRMLDAQDKKCLAFSSCVADAGSATPRLQFTCARRLRSFYPLLLLAQPKGDIDAFEKGRICISFNTVRGRICAKARDGCH